MDTWRLSAVASLDWCDIVENYYSARIEKKRFGFYSCSNSVNDFQGHLQNVNRTMLFTVPLQKHSQALCWLSVP